METGGRQPQRPFPGAVYGAVDLGTHNCRMLIARVEDDRRFRVIGSFSRAVRLGEGVAVNGRLAEEPELMNSEPYGAGWICVIELAGDTDGLMDAAAYRELIAE